MLRSLLNQRLGRYYIKEILGRGGMAAVYRAADTVLQRDVALKILYPQYSDDTSLVERFKREAVLAASLEHPNIVPIYDVGEQDGMAYITMKLLSGRTLQDRLQEAGAIGPEELVRLLEPVAAALDYAHARGVIHRDIKPGNIFLSQDGEGARPVLTDFGIAKQLDAPGLTTTGALIGTPDYMAPEQIAARPIDARVDVYALGMLAFRGLTGRRAFEGSTQDVLLGHLYGQAPRPSALNPALPHELDEVIARAIAASPAERYATAGAFVQALVRVAQGATAATAVNVGVGSPAQVAAGPGPAIATAPARAVQPQGRGRSSAPAQSPAAPPPPRPPVQAQGQGSASTLAPEGPAGQAPAGQPGRAAQAPWLLAVVLALLAGGLIGALGFALREQSPAGDATPVPPPPPSAAADTPTVATPTRGTATAEPPSPTADQGAAATATGAAPPPTRPTTASPPTTAPPPPIGATPSEPATLTPSSTATPATATPDNTDTATPTGTATTPPTGTATQPVACAEGLMSGGFQRLYDENVGVRVGLGCPQAREIAGDGSQQYFERGGLLWWSDRNRDDLQDHILVLYGLDSGAYENLTPEQVTALGPDPTPGPDPSQPQRGFGRVYFLKPGTRELLGAWTSPEIELEGGRRAVVQAFASGLMFWTPDYRPTGRPSIFVLYGNGTFERFDDTNAG